MNSSSSKNKKSKYENAKNVESTEKILDDSDLSKSNNDVMLQIEKEAKKLKSNIKEKDLKIFSKYEDLCEEDLLKLIKEKNENIIKINDEKEKRKNDLNKLIKKLNKAISTNADLLYKEETDPETLIELQKIIESKKKALKISKSLNQTFKNQYNSIANKASGSKLGNAGKNGNEAETHLIELKNENKNLELEIRKYKDDGISKKKELEIICEDKIYPGKIKKKTDENQNLLNQKHEYHKKMELSLNSIKNLIKELNHLEQIYSEIKNENNKDKENLDNKIMFWTDIIKSDLNGNEKEIIEKIVKNETKFIKETDKKVNKNEINGKIRSSSPDLNEKRYINQSLKKINAIKNLEIDETDNNKYKGKIIINKGINSKLIYSQTSGKNILTNISNRDKIQNKSPPKGVFAKFSYLKQKPNTGELKSNNKINNNKNNFEEKISEKKLENLIEKDYNDTTDADYRELLDKKTQYLETNLRLEENITKVQRTMNKKYDSVSQIIQENNNRLDLLKTKNDLLNKEINNLMQVYQLTFEQERIKYELKLKENQIKKEKKPIAINKLDISSLTEKDILNEMKESNDLIPKKNKNKSGYFMEKKENNNDNETREEKLEKIKKKYRDMNDESIEEIKE